MIQRYNKPLPCLEKPPVLGHSQDLLSAPPTVTIDAIAQARTEPVHRDEPTVLTTAVALTRPRLLILLLLNYHSRAKTSPATISLPSDPCSPYFDIQKNILIEDQVENEVKGRWKSFVEMVRNYIFLRAGRQSLSWQRSSNGRRVQELEKEHKANMREERWKASRRLV